MLRPDARHGKERNARGTREAILNAAEVVFAEHGFDGARSDDIAKVSGYNKSLIGQYFGGKLGLYTEVLKRADRELNALLAGVVAPLVAGENISSNVEELKAFVGTMVRTTFDYLHDHPCFLRVLTWEMANAWQTYLQIASQFMTKEGEQLESLFAKARKGGLLRSDFSIVIQLTMLFQACQSYLAFLPMYETELLGEDMVSDTALARAGKRIAAWVVAAMVTDLPDKERTNPRTVGGD